MLFVLKRRHANIGLKMTIEEIRRSGHEPYGDTLEAYAWYEAKEK